MNSLLEILRKVCSDHSFTVYAYCFMPDHLHLILTGESDSAQVAPVMQAFKSLSAAAAREMRVFDLWQKGYYDHVLRSGDSMNAAAEYLFLNPVRAGLVRRAEEWPFSGSFMFEWKKVLPIGQSFEPPWKTEMFARGAAVRNHADEHRDR